MVNQQTDFVSLLIRVIEKLFSEPHDFLWAIKHKNNLS